MKDHLEVMKAISENTDKNQLVQYIELAFNNLEAGSIQDIADLTRKSYNGVKKSGLHKKIKVGSLTIAFNDVKEDKFPF